jgi:hypothetical protein
MSTKLRHQTFRAAQGLVRSNQIAQEVVRDAAAVRSVP